MLQIFLYCITEIVNTFFLLLSLTVQVTEDLVQNLLHVLQIEAARFQAESVLVRSAGFA